jgi:hypothetical protein
MQVKIALNMHDLPISPGGMPRGGSQEPVVLQGLSPQLHLTHYQHLTQEQNLNYVLSTFLGRRAMLKVMVQEAAALASLSLFVGMVAIWSQVFTNM